MKAGDDGILFKEMQKTALKQTAELLEGKIVKIEESDSAGLEALRIFFTNGLFISVIRGQFAQGNEDKPYEISIRKYGITSEFVDLFDVEDSGDEVLGYCDVKKVQYYIFKVAAVSGYEATRLRGTE